MINVPAVVADRVRLEQLDRYNILDSASEVGFNDVVMLARKLCDTPIALVSLVAEKRQWFKAVSGLDVCETPIENSVCAHAMEQGSTLNIPDLTKDPRTRDNTLVTGPPFIRFYAGALLRSEAGVLLGTVCVIDTVERPGGLTPDQIESLEALARQVMIQLELRRAKIEAETQTIILHDNETRLRLAQEAGQIGSFEIDVSTNVMTVTEQFCRVFGLPYNAQTQPETVEALVHPDDKDDISTKKTRQNPKIPMNVEYRIKRADTGETAWVSRRAQFELDANGNPSRLMGTVHDITERKTVEDQIRLVNAELGHRMKNLMALVQAIASQTLKGVDPEPVNAFRDRIAALSRAQDLLIEQRWSSADIRDVVDRSLSAHGGQDRLRLSGPKILLDPNAVLSISLLLHELATNAVKYGSLSSPSGQVSVAWSRAGDQLELSWIEAGGPAVSEPTRTGLGTRLIESGLLGNGDVFKSYATAGFEARFRAEIAVDVADDVTGVTVQHRS